jgi:hypothetical protein
MVMTKADGEIALKGTLSKKAGKWSGKVNYKSTGHEDIFTGTF